MMRQKLSRRLMPTSVLFALALSATANAQVPYVSTQYAETYAPVTNGSPIVFTSTDDGARLVPIGFDFPYYGLDYAYINVGVNGVMSFAQPCVAGSCPSFSESCDPGANVCERSFMSTGSGGPLPNSSDPQATIAVFWDDLILDSGNQPIAQVVSRLSGTAPNRVFTVEWQNIRHYPRPTGSGFSYISMQARLHEGTGLIYLSYSTYTGGSNNSSWSGILGIEDHTGAVGISPLSCSSNASQCSYVDLSGLADQTFQIGPLTTAELIGEIRPSTGGNVGDPITVELDARNVGTVSSSIGFAADIYFSPDTIITPGVDTLLGTVNFNAVAAGDSDTQVLTSSVPAGAVPGYYTIGAVIDSTNVINEAVETNNTVSAPDGFLVGSEVSLAMDTVVVAPQGQVSTLTFRIVNEGSALAAVGWNLYLSSDSQLDASDTLVATGTSAVPAQPETTITATAVLPMVTPAQYYLIGVVDPSMAISEADETNNQAVSSAFLIGAELRVAVTAPAISGPGEPVQLQLELINDGWEIGTVQWSIYVSLDQMYDVMDNLVITGTTAMGRARSLPLTVSATVPLGILPQDQYFIAVIDPNNLVGETDENNNVGIAPSSTEMVGPDIVAESVMGALSMYRGEEYVVEAVLTNEGGATAENFYCGFYLSENLLITVTDPLLEEVGPITLAPGESTTIRHTVSSSRTAQLMAGLYHLGIIADSRTTVLEERENNNIKRMQDSTIEVRDPAPDFVVTDVRTSMLGSAGESVRLQRILENLGNAAGDFSYNIYLSTDRVFDLMGDQMIGSGSQTLVPGQQHNNIDTVRIPSTAPAGSYFVVYVADPDALVEELDETNNVSFSGQSITIEASSLQILSQVLPLGTIGLSYDFVLAAVGGSANLTWSISMGSLPAGLMLDASQGRITGTPTVEGSFPLEISVTDGALVSTRNFNFIVSTPSIGLNLITRGVPPAWIGRSYEYPLTARGGIPPYQWSADGIIPRGLILDEDGVLRGTPIIAGSNVVTFRVIDALGAFDERPIAIRIIGSDDAVRFSTDILRDGVVNRMYDETLRAINGVSPYTFELAEGELPPGLVLDGDKVTGVPTRVGVYSFSIRVVDNRGDFDLNHFVVTVVAEDALQFVTNGLPAGQTDQPYLNSDGTQVLLKAISPAGNETVRYSIVSGELPPGITMSENGLFEGQPTKDGVYDFLIAAVDGQNQTNVAGLGILVFTPQALTTAPSDSDAGCGCQTTQTNTSGFTSFLLLLGLMLFSGRRLRKFVWVAVLFGMVSLSTEAYAQSVPYFHSQATETYVARSGGTPLTFSSTDDGEATATLPFPFKFFNATYTSVKVSTNGYLSFDTGRATDFTNDPIPSSSTPNNIIAVVWDDLTSPVGSLHIEGMAPSRVAIIQWENARHLGSSTGRLDFQVKLYEGPSGKFEIHYGNPAAVSTGLSASVGYENDSGSEGHSFLSCTPNCGTGDITNAANQVYRALQDAGEDVMAGPIVSPVSVYQAISFDVQSTIISQHQNPIGPFQYQIHLMSPGETTPNNPVFTSTTGLTLTPYEIRQVVSSISIPIQTLPGRYRLALVVDSNDDIMEPDENNNVFISQSDIIVAERLPDFTVPSISVAETTLMPGGTFTLNLELRNAGNLAGSAEWEVFISPNSIISVDDVSSHTATVSLDSLTSQNVQLQLTLPTSITPGRYWIGAIVDASNSVLELDEINNIGTSANPVAVGVSFVDITTPSLPGGYLGIDYSTFLRATGGDGVFQWSKISGDWPDGISLVPSTGEIRGRPTIQGDYDIGLRVLSNGLTAEKTMTLSINPLTGGLTIATRNLLPGIVGQDYPPVEPGSPAGSGQRIIALGGMGAVMFSLSGLPPPGLSMDSDGYLSGVPSQSGRFDVQVMATDGTETASRTLALTVVEPGRLTLVSEVLDAEVEESYRYPLQALGTSDTATLSFSIQAGALPPGLSLTENGLIVGVPIEVGQTDFAIEVVEGSGPAAARDTANYTIIVRSTSDFAITPSELQAATVGDAYEASLDIRGGTPPFTWSVAPVAGALPRGLRYEVESDMGRERIKILGTPEELPAGPSAEQPPVGCACGISTLLVGVRDSVGRQTQRAISLKISLPAGDILSPTTASDDGCSCAAVDSTTDRENWSVFTSLFVLFALILRRRRAAIR